MKEEGEFPSIMDDLSAGTCASRIRFTVHHAHRQCVRYRAFIKPASCLPRQNP